MKLHYVTHKSMCIAVGSQDLEININSVVISVMHAQACACTIYSRDLSQK